MSMYDKMMNHVVAVIHNRVATTDVNARVIAKEILGGLPEQAYGSSHAPLIAELVTARLELEDAEKRNQRKDSVQNQLCVVCGGIVEDENPRNMCRDCFDSKFH